MNTTYQVTSSTNKHLIGKNNDELIDEFEMGFTETPVEFNYEYVMKFKKWFCENGVQMEWVKR